MKVRADITIVKHEARVYVRVKENKVSTTRWETAEYIDENGTHVQVEFAQRTGEHSSYLEGKYPRLNFYMPRTGEEFAKNFLSVSNAITYGAALERGLRILNGEKLVLTPGVTNEF